jgi:hypothetical protein
MGSHSAHIQICMLSECNWPEGGFKKPKHVLKLKFSGVGLAY